MNELIAVEPHCEQDTDLCPHCGGPIDSDGNSVPRGLAVRGRDVELVDAGDGASAALAAPKPQAIVSGPIAALNHRWVVFTLLCVAGPLGLPALWFSPRFSRLSKTIWTVVFFLLTVVLPLVGAWFLFELVLRPIVYAMVQANAAS